MGHVKKYVTNARILPTDGQTLLTDKLRELGRRSRQYNPADFAILHDRSSNFLKRKEQTAAPAKKKFIQALSFEVKL